MTNGSMPARAHGLRRSCAARRVAAVLLMLAAWAAAAPSRATAQGFSGALMYTGSLGPVTDRRPLCVCIYTDPQLTSRLGCLIEETNGPRYAINTRMGSEYFVIAFLDIHINEDLDPDEPYEIFNDRAAAPGDPVIGNSGRSDVDLVFGDENLPGANTPTATTTSTVTVTSTASEMATPTATPIPPPLPGDCDGNGVVSVNELVRAVAIALETVDLSMCRAADEDGDGHVRINELLRAVGVALGAGPVQDRRTD